MEGLYGDVCLDPCSLLPPDTRLREHTDEPGEYEEDLDDDLPTGDKVSKSERVKV